MSHVVHPLVCKLANGKISIEMSDCCVLVPLVYIMCLRQLSRWELVATLLQLLWTAILIFPFNTTYISLKRSVASTKF